MKATNIIWDADDPEDLEGLPTEIDIPEGMTDEDTISDYLSDLTGFCHKGFALDPELGERTYIVTELCPHCEAEVEIHGWDTDCNGFKAFCPYCGSPVAEEEDIFEADDLAQEVREEAEEAEESVAEAAAMTVRPTPAAITLGPRRTKP